MCTKTILALALALTTSTATGALAATKHESVSGNHVVADARTKKTPEQSRHQDQTEFVAGNMLFVAFHEMAHALVGQLHLPVLGRAEAAADSFATMALLEEGTEFSVNVLVQAARGLFLMDRRDRRLKDQVGFYDAHGPHQQRAYDIICLMVGSDAKQFKELADWAQMPEDRQQGCRRDYEDTKYSWDMVLKEYRRSADRPKSAIAVVYEAGEGQLDTYARSFRSVGFMETLAAYASSRYMLPSAITLTMASCGDANAWWEPSTLQETLCYEMAEDFLELYQGYAVKAAAHKKMQTNELVARDVRRIHLTDKAAAATVATASGVSESSGDLFETLALNLKVATAAYFAPPAKR